MRLNKRVEDLEREAGDSKPWHRFIVHVGETEEEARAAYEAENGPIGDDNCIIVRLVAPSQRREVPCG